VTSRERIDHDDKVLTPGLVAFLSPQPRKLPLDLPLPRFEEAQSLDAFLVECLVEQLEDPELVMKEFRQHGMLADVVLLGGPPVDAHRFDISGFEFVRVFIVSLAASKVRNQLHDFARRLGR
jgi:hypothetical protein